MSLDEVINSIVGGDDGHDSRAQELKAKLDLLKQRTEHDGHRPTQVELLEGVRDQFELISSSCFLDEADWLMNAITFTTDPISSQDFITAWGNYISANPGAEPFDYCDYPILESMAQWYFNHREEAGRDEKAMVLRALSVYEHLIQAVRGREADPEYQDVLSGNGVAILYLYCGLKMFERAKFYAQLLEMEHVAGRLDDESHDWVSRAYKKILSDEDQRESERTALGQITWDTISDYQRKNDALERRLAEVEARSRANHPDEFQKAQEKLLQRFGRTWHLLNSTTRNCLERAEAYSSTPLAEHSPDMPPSSVFKAVNSELRAILFQPRGILHESLLDQLNIRSEASLLVEYHRASPSLPMNVYLDVASALVRATSGKKLPQRIVSKLETLRKHRVEADHSKRTYKAEDLRRFLLEIMSDDWLKQLFSLLHSKNRYASS